MNAHTDGTLATLASRAAGLMWRDRRVLLLAYLLFAAPSLLLRLAPTETMAKQLGILLLWRAFHLAGTLAVFYPALRSLQNRPGPALARIARFFSVGFLVFAVLLAPVVLGELSGKPELLLFGVAGLLPPFFVLIFRYYLYQVPLLLRGGDLRSVFRSADALLRGRRMLPLLLLVAPLGWYSLYASIVRAPVPDLSVPAFEWLLRAGGGIAWLLHAYLCLAAALTFSSDTDSVAGDFVPYRDGRLDTLVARAPRPLPYLLSVRSGVILLGVSSCVHLGNTVRLQRIPPAAQYRVEQIELLDKLVRVVVRLEDPDKRLRSLFPLAFRLANDRNTPLDPSAPPPRRAVFSESGESVLFGLEAPRDQATLVLDFSATRDAAQLAQLEDLHLWYRGVKLALLDMKKARVLGSAASMLEHLAPSETELTSPEATPIPDATPAGAPE